MAETSLSCNLLPPIDQLSTATQVIEDAGLTIQIDSGDYGIEPYLVFKEIEGQIASDAGLEDQLISGTWGPEDKDAFLRFKALFEAVPELRNRYQLLESYHRINRPFPEELSNYSLKFYPFSLLLNGRTDPTIKGELIGVGPCDIRGLDPLAIQSIFHQMPADVALVYLKDQKISQATIHRAPGTRFQFPTVLDTVTPEEKAAFSKRKGVPFEELDPKTREFLRSQNYKDIEIVAVDGVAGNGEAITALEVRSLLDVQAYTRAQVIFRTSGNSDLRKTTLSLNSNLYPDPLNWGIQVLLGIIGNRSFGKDGFLASSLILGAGFGVKYRADDDYRLEAGAGLNFAKTLIWDPLPVSEHTVDELLAPQDPNSMIFDYETRVELSGVDTLAVRSPSLYLTGSINRTFSNDTEVGIVTYAEFGALYKGLQAKVGTGVNVGGDTVIASILFFYSYATQDVTFKLNPRGEAIGKDGKRIYHIYDRVPADDSHLVGGAVIIQIGP